MERREECLCRESERLVLLPERLLPRARRPAIVQDTGFGHAIPTSHGVLPFGTIEEALDAIGKARPIPPTTPEPPWISPVNTSILNRVLTRLINQAGSRG